MSFINNNKVVIAVTTAAGATATSAITSAAVDTQGFGGCCFLVAMGPITTSSATSYKIQQSDDDAVADDYSDVADTNVAIADDYDNKVSYLDIVRPGKRYLKMVITRATQASTVGSVLAILYRARNRSVTQPAGVTGEAYTSPLEGSA